MMTQYFIALSNPILVIKWIFTNVFELCTKNVLTYNQRCSSIIQRATNDIYIGTNVIFNDSMSIKLLIVRFMINWNVMTKARKYLFFLLKWIINLKSYFKFSICHAEKCFFIFWFNNRFSIIYFGTTTEKTHWLMMETIDFDKTLM